MQIIMPILMFAAVAIFIIFALIAAKKRREALRGLAQSLGLSFDPDKNISIGEQYSFLDKLHQGHSRYAKNHIYGIYQGYEIDIFDFHYTTGSGKNQQHHVISFFMLKLPCFLPELTIVRENFLSKIAQAVGYDDIDFESHEFSRKFCVRSRDKKFAYDICHTLMIEYLLANSDLNIEIESNILSICLNKELAVEQIQPNLNRLIEVRKLMPDYLFQEK